jgi:hypothetical protein
VTGASEYDVVRPDPSGTLQALTALGYSPEAAIADIVDNSIAAHAAHVRVLAQWDGAKRSWIAVIDDGDGMDEQALVRGLTPGQGAMRERSKDDLGRFGMGLKTASFSQARQLIVASRAEPAAAFGQRTWDVDHVLAVQDWQLMHGCPDDAASDLERLLTYVPNTGTVVLWRGLTRLVPTGSRPGDDAARAAFYAQLSRIESHLGMVFSRYLSARMNPLRITLNDRLVEPWDPFLPGYPQVEALPRETPVPGVDVQGFVLPHRSRLDDTQVELGGGPRGWLDQQGFYVYRKDRLIVAGDWLNIGRFRKDEKHALARIRVQLPIDQDIAWALDVKKSMATPPQYLMAHLLRISKATRERASAVINHRGRVLRDARSNTEDFTWRQVAQHGEKRFLINRNHALIRDLIENNPDQRNDIRAVLTMIETTLPVGLIRTTPDVTASSADVDEEIPTEVLALASRVLGALVARGTPVNDAVQRTGAMPPFSDFPGLVDRLRGADSDNETGTN